MKIAPEEILDFWFNEIGPKRWSESDEAMGELLRQKFFDLHESAVKDELSVWKETPESAIALLLLLDAFPRRMFKGTPRAYLTNDEAVILARESIVRHFDDRIDKSFKLYFYLPFSHSEHLDDHRLAVFYVRERTKEPDWVDYVTRRFRLIEKFGRFPNRNAILGRPSTPEEEAFLKTKG